MARRQNVISLYRQALTDLLVARERLMALKTEVDEGVYQPFVAGDFVGENADLTPAVFTDGLTATDGIIRSIPAATAQKMQRIRY